MKKTTVAFMVFVFVTAVVISGCSTMSTGKAGGGTARIKSLDGNAEIARTGGNWEPAHLWQRLRTGDRARTAAHGKIDFSLGKYGGVLTLMPESAITFEQLGPTSPDDRIVAIVNLSQGRVVGDTLKLPSGKRIQIKTAGGVYEIP